MINKELIEKAAYNYNPVQKLDNEFIRAGFKAGVNWALKEVKDSAIEFVEWVDKYGYIYDEKSKIWAYWDNPTEEFSTKELFEIFLKEKNGNKD